MKRYGYLKSWQRKITFNGGHYVKKNICQDLSLQADLACLFYMEYLHGYITKYNLTTAQYVEM